MPEKKRVEREAEKKYNDAALNDAKKNPPKHLLDRMGRYSPLAESVKHNFHKEHGSYVGFSECGQVIACDTSKRDKFNALKHNERKEQIEILYREFRSDWGHRGVAKRIASQSKVLLGKSLSADTVRQYMRDFPNGI
jgi:hypothetical protein